MMITIILTIDLFALPCLVATRCLLSSLHDCGSAIQLIYGTPVLFEFQCGFSSMPVPKIMIITPVLFAIEDTWNRLDLPASPILS